MRIVGGSARGRTLKAPRGDKTRPTTDRVREAVMSMLASRGALEDAAVLDLYAGSGALALEAISRGAASACLVDNAAASQRVIAENATTLGFDRLCKVLALDVERALKNLARVAACFDVVFADPPYDDKQAWETLGRLGELGLLAEDAVLVVEHSSRETPPARLAGLELDLARCYGDSAIALYDGHGDEARTDETERDETERDETERDETERDET